MSFVAIFMTVFSVLGAADLIIGNRFGIGKEFQKGFFMFGNLALSMIGMIVLAPAIGGVLQPICNVIYNSLGIDPSIIPSMIFANDMGGAALAKSVAVDSDIGGYNALIISSMMGCTISFTIPCALNIVKPENRKSVLLGFLCGIITIPIGCFASGVVLRLPIMKLLLNLLPMIAFSVIIACGLIFIPKICVKVFGVFGKIINILILIGLTLGILKFLTGFEIVKGLTSIEEAGIICLNASIVMSGAFPFLFILSKFIKKPLKILSQKANINEEAALGFVSTLAVSITTFEKMSKMDEKGMVLNSAFAISAAFVFADHLAFTLAFDEKYVFSMIIGKLISGITAIFLANIIFVKVKN